MEHETLKKAKRHFSQLGLMYFFGTLIIFAVQILSSSIMAAINPDTLENTDFLLIISMLPMYAIAMPLMALLIRIIPSNQPIKRKMTARQFFTSFLMCYAIMYISNIIGQILTVLIGTIKGQPITNSIVEIASNISPWVSILIMVILAPIAEEFLFRKLLIDRSVKYGEGISILLSGLMFGLFHGNLNQFAYAFTLGLFFGFIYVKTGNIIYTIILHMLINFMGSVASLLLLEQSGYYDIVTALEKNSSDITFIVMEHLPQLILLGLFGFVLFVIVISGIILLFLNFKRFTCNTGELLIPKGKRFSTIFLNIGMLLFSLFWMAQIILQLFE